MMSHYRLIASVPAHEGPIKALWSSSSNLILTGGQDSIVRVWSVEQDENRVNLTEALPPLYHSHWITAVAELGANCHPLYPNGLIITGCMDNVIRLYDKTGHQVGQLVGHDKPVISFSWTENYSLISGSWDGTARRWNLQSYLCTLNCQGHENGVHVLCLDNEILVTVSTGEQVNNKPANFRLRLWSLSTGQMLGSPIEDHSGPIRSVFRIPGIGFGTTSNDGMLCFRGPDGLCVGICTHDPQDEGYPPFLLDGTAVYFEDAIGGAVTCGEDGSVVIWKGTDYFQSIPHPACVWAVATLGATGNDIITACHDGFLRIFSRNTALGDLESSLQLQIQFESEVESAKVARKKGPSQEEIQKSPKWENRMTIPGTSEGQVRIFNKDGVAIAAQWSAISGIWIEIGEVTGSAGSSDGGQLNGVIYDHIIPVEIETPGGVQELKLGYNDTESHFTAAQRFIDDNMLDQGYLRQIADFIAARAGKSNQPTFDMTSPSQQSVNSSAAPAPIPSKPQPPSYKTFPSPLYYTFDDVPSMAQLRKLTAKVSEFNDSVSDSSKLSPSELEYVNDLGKILGETSYYHSSTIPPQLINVVAKMIQSWDDDRFLFPSYDLSRMVCLHPSGSSLLANSKHLPTILKRALNLLSMESSQLASLGSPQSLLCLRFLTNILKVDRLCCHQILFHQLHWHQLNEFLPLYLTCGKKTHRYAAFLFLCNLIFSIFNPLLITNANSSRPPLPALDILRFLFPHLVQALQHENESLDSIFKGLVTLGTIFVAGKGDIEMALYLNGFSSQISSLLASITVQWAVKERALGEYVDEVEKAFAQLSR